MLQMLIGHEDGHLINGGVEIYYENYGLFSVKNMKATLVLSTANMLCLTATEAQAAVDITGFTVSGGGTPIGLILITLLLVGLGASAIKRA